MGEVFAKWIASHLRLWPTKSPARFSSHRSKKEIALQDKGVALVTGANQGIGRQIAKDLVAHGFTVLVGSRSLERGEAAAKTIDG
jgi:3-oxoacyl-ACP reductase-like protein